MSNIKNTHWFPGHMKKALDAIQEKLPIVDYIIEVVDARAPLASMNPYLDKILGTKPIIILMAKKDLADPHISSQYQAYFKAKGIDSFLINLLNKSEVKSLVKYLEKIPSPKAERFLKNGLKVPPLRALVVGIPNVGKSSFINKMVGKEKASVQNTPGHTKSLQWVKVSDKFELLDSPGVLPPSYEEAEIAKILAAIGSIKQEILPINDLALFVSEHLLTNYSYLIKSRYNIDPSVLSEPSALITEIAKVRSYILKGNQYDFERATITLLNEFKNGIIGPISFIYGL